MPRSERPAATSSRTLVYRSVVRATNGRARPCTSQYPSGGGGLRRGWGWFGGGEGGLQAAVVGGPCELSDGALETVRNRGERLRQFHRLPGHLCGDPRRVRDGGDASGDFGGGHRLLFDGAGDGGGDLADPPHDLADLADRLRRGGGTVVDAVGSFGDRGGGLGGLLRQALDLLGDDGEALAGFAGAGGLDGRVESEQVRLRGDRLDQLDHAADLAAGLTERRDHPARPGGGGHRGLRDLGRLGRVPGDLRDA